MYLPGHFAEPERDVLHELMQAHPLASLVSLTSDGLVANHIPLLFSAAEGECGVLRGHVARANPLWRETTLDTEVLAIFQGPGHYISPGWYPGKKEHGKVVPTWNYAVVHAAGPLRIVDDAQWLRNFLTQLTAQHEASMLQPWRIDDAPDDYIEKMLSAIVGIEIPITTLRGKWKVSQNQSAANRQGVIAGLHAVNTPESIAMAELVARKAP